MVAVAVGVGVAVAVGVGVGVVVGVVVGVGVVVAVVVVVGVVVVLNQACPNNGPNGKEVHMRGKVFDAEFFRGEVSRLTAWLGDLGITPEQRSQWNRELESAKQHLAEFGGK